MYVIRANGPICDLYLQQETSSKWVEDLADATRYTAAAAEDILRAMSPTHYPKGYKRPGIIRV